MNSLGAILNRNLKILRFNKQIFNINLKNRKKFGYILNLDTPNLLICKYSSTDKKDPVFSNSKLLSKIDDENLEEDIDNRSDSESLRQILYPNSDDPIIKQLNLCASVQDVLNILNNSIENFNSTHTSQVVLVLWDLQRNFFNITHLLSEDSYKQPNLDTEILFKNYIKQISSHELFEKLLLKIKETLSEFDLNTLTYTLLYLSKMGVPMTNDTMQELVNKYVSIANNSEIEIPMTSVSRFLVAVSQEKGYYPIFASLSSFPRVLHALDHCNCPEEFRLITICLNCLHQIVTRDILENYKNRAEHLLETDVINENTTRTIIKVIQLLNYPHWVLRNSSTIRKFLLQLKGNLSQIDKRELVTVNKAIISQLEPRNLLTEVQETAFRKFFEDTVDPQAFHSPHILSCMVPFTSQKKRLTFEKIVRNYIDNGVTATTIPALFNVLRYLKTSDYKLCYDFWQRVLEYLRNNPDQRVDYKLFRIAHYYMHFNNNLAATFRHFEFESQMISWLIAELEENISKLIPGKFSRALQFIIAYGFTTRNRKEALQYLSSSKDALIDMSAQFNHIDCINLSHGLRIAIEFNNRYPVRLLDDYRNIFNSILFRCITLQLNDDLNVEINDLSNLSKSYLNSVREPNIQLVNKLFQKYIKYFRTHELTSSRLVKDLSFMCLSTNCLVPNILDRVSEYITANKNYVLGNTTHKVLYTCYQVGYLPKTADEFLNACIEILESEKERMTCLSLLESSISLMYFQKLPLTLVHHIFSENFLEQIDQEIAHCYSKTSYPTRIRNNLMQLNRAVCLDMPDTNIPWFHQKFCDQLEKNDSRNYTTLSLHFLSILIEVVGGQEYIEKNVYTPYSYKIDYLIHLDKRKNIIPIAEIKQRKESNTNFNTRIAFLILNPNAITNLNTNLKGLYQLKHRHLEILGYRVVFINPVLWNSIYLKQTRQRIDYIKSHIWPEQYSKM